MDKLPFLDEKMKNWAINKISDKSANFEPELVDSISGEIETKLELEE